MAKKFDTNPLDPEFPEKVLEAERMVQGKTQHNQNGKTQKFSNTFETEDQTRKLNETEFNSFQSDFGNKANQPSNYQPKPLHTDNNVDANKPLNIGSISLPENILLALPYIPFMIGLVAGIIELIFIPKNEPKVRFHAAQGLAAHLGVLIVTTILGFASMFTDLANTASGIFSLVTTIMLIVFAVKAWQGKPIHIESVEELTDWLEDKIKPQN